MKAVRYPAYDDREQILANRRDEKMARSAHAFVRGNTVQFYEWLRSLKTHALREVPPIWICGDCHLGNLGPIADAKGRIEIEIRDLDQTVIGNPAHDLIRLGLSLASAARDSNLPGAATTQMIEQMIEGYEQAFAPEDSQAEEEPPQTATVALRQAAKRSWKHLARERIEDTDPVIPLGKRFWPISEEERQDISRLFQSQPVHRLATLLRSREDDAEVRILDAAYWMKGCSSLGLLRYCVLLGIGGSLDEMALCLMDVKEAAKSAAPRRVEAQMPLDDAERVVAGARHLSPFLGNRMHADSLLGRPIFVRELLPQDLKIEIGATSHAEALRAARYLASVVGKAHARQMNEATRSDWRKELGRSQFRSLNQPSWLWSSVVDLLLNHERGYLEFCRTYAMGLDADPKQRAASS